MENSDWPKLGHMETFKKESLGRIVENFPWKVALWPEKRGQGKHAWHLKIALLSKNF